ncbi:hypothetical protein SGRA_1909 [Saprospira grandis str. Lewin]|uniref:Uncharacterized protein n=1 Tax=Saprospira grandis (strain Lewin) TaxID=984262 RepID=H6L1J9_SAPGL|nr:hypothetical protein SGRA_1909 [Saprospira grandis str. Lewin]
MQFPNIRRFFTKSKELVGKFCWQAPFCLSLRPAKQRKNAPKQEKAATKLFSPHELLYFWPSI